MGHDMLWGRLMDFFGCSSLWVPQDGWGYILILSHFGDPKRDGAVWPFLFLPVWCACVAHTAHRVQCTH